MPYRVLYLEDEGIVFTEYTLPYGPEDFAGCIAANMEVADEHGALLFLGDCTGMPGASSAFDVYRLGALFDEMGVDRRIREALVITPDPDIVDTFEFFVTVTSNRGIVVRAFETVEAAREWLLEEGALIRSGLDTTPARAATLHGTTE